MVINIQKNTFNEVKFHLPIRYNFVSVIIPVYRDAKGLHDTLNSLQKQTLGHNKYEIIVANDGADEQISHLCKEFNVKEIKITPNRGSYKARNMALEESQGEFFAFTDADVVVTHNWLEKGLITLQNFEYVGGPIQYPKNNNLSITEKYLINWEFNFKYLFEIDKYGVTANLFTSRHLIELLGGFDSRLESGGDNEFGNRVHSVYPEMQFFDYSNYVIHPFRNYQQIISKKKRLMRGLLSLVKYHPTRYSKYTFILVDELVYTLHPPTEYLNDFGLFLFAWYMKFFDFYLNLRFRRDYMIIFNRKSHILKFINKISTLFKFK